MNETFSNFRLQKRYCPVVQENVMVKLQEDFTQNKTEIKCHNMDNCIECFGKCQNKYISGSN